MKKLFICQPLNNKTDEDILQMKKQAIKIAKERLGEKVEIVYDNTPAPKDAKPLWFFWKIYTAVINKRRCFLCRRLEGIRSL